MNEKLKDALESIDFSLRAFKSVNDEALLMLTKILEPCGEGGVALLEEGLLDGEFVPMSEPYPQEFKPVTAIRYWNGRLEVFLADYNKTEHGWDILLGGKWVSDVERLSIDWWFLLSELKDRLDEHTPGYEDEIKPYMKEEDEEIYITPKGDREICVDMHFEDGVAKGDYVTLMYPKIGDLTPAEIKEIDEYTGGRLSDSGCITPYDVALKFGEIVCFGIMDTTNGHNDDLVRDINRRWVEDKEMFKPILCALYARDIAEITDADSFQIEEWKEWPEFRIGCATEKWDDYNMRALKEMCADWESFADNYLQHIADDQDLEVILMFVRYDRSEN